MSHWSQHPSALRAIALAAALVLSLLPGFLWPDGVAAIEDRAGDHYWRLTASSTVERRVVLVDIDERSLREIGPWPWPRATLAKLVDAIGVAGAAGQAIDIVLAESRDGDAELDAAITRYRPVLAQLFSLDPEVTPSVGVVAGGLPAGCDESTPPSFGHYGIAATLTQASAVAGHITPRVDADGVIRHLPARICHAGQAHPTLALAALLGAADGGSADEGRATPQSARTHWKPAAASQAGWQGWSRPVFSLVTDSLPGLTVPLDGSGNLRVPYRLAREAFVSLSAADVLRGSAESRANLRHRLVLVGSSAFGMGDTVATPLAAVSSGLEVHAQTLVALIDGAIPYTPAGWPALQGAALAIVLSALWVTGRSVRGAPAKRLPLVGAGLAAAALGGAALALWLAQWWLPWFTVVGFSLLGAAALATADHALARAQRERLSAHLGAYLPAPVAARLMTTEPTGDPQFESRTVSVLVSSVRNFPALAGVAPPEELAALLHAYCCLAVDVVERHGGVVEHVVGDAVTAVWNSERGVPDHPRRAAEAARELVATTTALFASRRPVRENESSQPLALGIGLECGPVLVGSYGPSRRRAHAILGEPVSMALRLQQLTADLSVPILVGPQLASQLPRDMTEPLGDFLLEGHGRHVSLAGLTGWAQLVDVDAAWAASATSGREGGAASEGDGALRYQRSGAVPRRVLPVVAARRRRA